MVNKNKVKGTSWENQFVDILTEKLGGHWKRIPASGSLGTIMDESILQGDINGKVRFLPKKFKVEAKVGYGGAEHMTMRREWLEKIKAEAILDNAYPLLACKFSNARGKVKYFVSLDLESFIELLKQVEDMYDELVRLYDKDNATSN